MDEKAFEAVLDEVRLLFHVLVQKGEALHDREGITMGMRAVLEHLDRDGPARVPVLARRRRVSRQHIQSLVNPLLELGYVRAADNPDHKRSPLIELTRPGERTLARMRRRETQAFEEADPRVSRARLRETAEVLRRIRDSLEV